MWLQAAGVRALHVFPNAGDTACIHYVVSQSRVFKQVLEVRTIDGFGDGLRQFSPYFRALAVTDRLD
jgi:hypothetical protein